MTGQCAKYNEYDILPNHLQVTNREQKRHRMRTQESRDASIGAHRNTGVESALPPQFLSGSPNNTPMVQATGTNAVSLG